MFSLKFKRIYKSPCLLFVAAALLSSATVAAPPVVSVHAVGGARAAADKPFRTTVEVSPAEPPQEPEAPLVCPPDTIEVAGDYCPALEQKCKRWLDGELKLRCAEFEKTGKCQTKTTKKHFCIDKYEFPNRAGEKPVIMKTWYEAGAACKQLGKRLCKDSEWTLACEGPERLPYPYGYTRNAEACNIDQPRITPDERALGNSVTRDAEVARLDQRVASGSLAACTSPFGVHDMAGNVDEWVVNESATPYQSGSKGGYWGPVRTRCRPMTVAHYEMFSFYQLGFRCCADAKEPETPSSVVATR
jgi:formylglycine-generating enzyme